MLIVYSKDNCPKCVDAVRYLNEHNIEFKQKKIVANVVDSETQISRNEFVESFPSVRTAPFFVYNDIQYLNIEALKTVL